MRQGTLRLLMPLLVLTVGLLSGWPPAQCQPASPTPPNPAQPQTQAQIQVPSGPGGIAFLRDDGIYYLPPGGGQPVRLRQGKFPALSPDGKRLAFCLERKELDRNALERMNTGEAILEAASFIGGLFGSRLRVLDISTGQEKALLDSEELIRNPVWSPTGDRLAFAVKKGKNVQLDVIQTDGSGRRLLFPLKAGEKLNNIWGLYWAPDGKGLWFHDMRHLFRVDEKGALLAKTPVDAIMGKQSNVFILISGEDRFVPNPANPQLLAFTRRVKAPKAFAKVFKDDFPEINAVFFYHTGTKTRTRLTPKDMWASHPCWSRDGQYLYFEGYRQPHYREEDPFRIYRIQRDGKGLQEITRGQAPSL